MSPSQIIDITASVYGFVPQDLLRRNRTEDLALARHVAMAVIRETFPHLSYSTIGDFFKRDHGTVLYAIQRVCAMHDDVRVKPFIKIIRQRVALSSHEAINPSYKGSRLLYRVRGSTEIVEGLVENFSATGEYTKIDGKWHPIDNVERIDGLAAEAVKKELARVLPVAPGADIKDVEKLFASVNRGDGCWQWRAGLNASRYGMACHNGKNWIAHRLAYQLCVGPIPDGMFVCHHCDNPTCVRPDHLFIGTAQDNTDDMIRKGRAKHQKKKRVIGVTATDLCT